MKVYNKLIRDNIPSIIEKENKTCIVTILNEVEFLVELKKKLIEESTEVSKANMRHDLVNELADVQEIVDKIKEVYQIKHEEITLIQQSKAIKNGKFDKKLFLVSVEDNHE